MPKVFSENKAELISSFSENKFQNIFLVRGGSSYELSGAKAFIESAFNISGYYTGFDINPQINDLEKGIEIFKKGHFDGIIAIGGGSAIDMAKLISVFAHQENSIETILNDNKLINNTKTPLLAIPTTAGTGAEATAFSVLYVNKKKYSVASNTMLPDYVYLSHQFSLSASAYLTACTGSDAFCQAIESVWSVNSTSESEEYAFKAVELIWNNLGAAVNSNHIGAKKMMQEASFLAGKAINITKTTAPHAISYAFTSYYGIPHGHAVSISLPYFFEFNCNIQDHNCVDKRGSAAVLTRLDRLLEIMNLRKDNIKDGLVSFFTSIGINTDISSLIDGFDARLIKDNVNIERLKNNPRRINEDDIDRFMDDRMLVSGNGNS